MADVTITMPQNGTDTYTLQTGIRYIILDPGGENNFPQQCEGHLHLNLPSGAFVCYSITGDLNPIGARLDIFTQQNPDLDNYRDAGLTGNFSQSGILSNHVYLWFRADCTTPTSGFRMELYITPNVVTGLNFSFDSSQVPHTVTASWGDAPSQHKWRVVYGRDNAIQKDTVVTTPSVTFPAEFSSCCCHTFKVWNYFHDSVQSCLNQSSNWCPPAPPPEPCDLHVYNIRLQHTSVRSALFTWNDAYREADRWNVHIEGYGHENDYLLDTLVFQRRLEVYDLEPLSQYRITIMDTIPFIADMDTCYKFTMNFGTDCDYDVYNIRHFNITDTSAQISWMDTNNSSRWWVVYTVDDGLSYDTIETRSTGVTLTGLPPGTRCRYSIQSNSTSIDHAVGLPFCYQIFATKQENFCGAWDKLTLAAVERFSAGTRGNPSLYYSEGQGAIDTNVNAYDPRTGNLLPVVCPGFSSSIRIGNWYGSFSRPVDQLIYRLEVDTSKTNLIGFWYSAVLQAFGHDHESEPKFRFRILDNRFRPINEECYAFDYVADTRLGWNRADDSVIWKDWTQIGINLNPFHGQTILIELTTFDCTHGGHYGYARVAFECIKTGMTLEGCGLNPDITLTAPYGFSYAWFDQSRPGDTLSKDRVYVTQDEGHFICRMNTIGQTNDNCAFNMHCDAFHRFPYARYSKRYEREMQCHRVYQFDNESIITKDEEHQRLTDIKIKNVEWDFDDGWHSLQWHPIHGFAPGWHWVKLKATMDDGICSETIIDTFYVPPVCTDTIFTSLCSEDCYTLFDTVVCEPGWYERDSALHYRYLHLDKEQTAEAILFITPQEVPPQGSDIFIEDASVNGDYRKWYIDYQLQDHDAKSFYYSYPIGKDSMHVKLVVESVGGCKDSAVAYAYSHQVSLYVPNVFTPNLEGENSHFGIYGSNILSAEVVIYKRNGDWVCTFDGLTEKWDGTKDGIELPQESYVYLIHYTTIQAPREVHTKKGSVLLLR